VIPCDKSEWVAAYNLGSLDADEREQFERHLPTCQSCQADLRAYQSLMGELALAVPQVEPPARLRRAILQKTAPAAAQPTQPGRRFSATSWLGQLFQTHRTTWVIASLLVILALIATNVFIVVQYNQRQQAEAMPFHVVILHDASNPQDDLNGMLVISDDGQFGTLITDNLKVLTAQSNYQLWLVKDGTRTSGGVFSVNDAGYGWLKITSKTSLLSYQSFGVTVEPAGGSMAPTGLKVLGGNQ
jgi:anti-sigma-K factor RskA